MLYRASCSIFHCLFLGYALPFPFALSWPLPWLPLPLPLLPLHFHLSPFSISCRIHFYNFHFPFLHLNLMILKNEHDNILITSAQYLGTIVAKLTTHSFLQYSSFHGLFCHKCHGFSYNTLHDLPYYYQSLK